MKCYVCGEGNNSKKYACPDCKKNAKILSREYDIPYSKMLDIMKAFLRPDQKRYVDIDSYIEAKLSGADVREIKLADIVKLKWHRIKILRDRFHIPIVRHGRYYYVDKKYASDVRRIMRKKQLHRTLRYS